MKKLPFFAIIIVLLSACVAKPVEPVSQVNVFQEAQQGIPFRWAHDNGQHPVVKIMVAGFLQGCKDYEVLCENMMVNEENTAAVLSMMEQSVDLGSSGQIFPIYLPSHYQPAIEMGEKGIPVVGVHFPVDKANVPNLLAWVAPDNKEYSTKAGYAMAEKVQCQGSIGITQSSLNDGENTVTQYFKDAYLEKCPDGKVLDVQIEGLDDPAKAISVASAIIQANPDISGGFSSTGAGSTTWAKGAEDAGKKPGEVAIISMDYTKQNLDLVKSGEVYMLVGQPLFEEFYYAIGVLVAARMGFPVPYENILPAPMITIDNIDQYYAINELAESIQVK